LSGIIPNVVHEGNGIPNRALAFQVKDDGVERAVSLIDYVSRRYIKG